MTSTYQRSYHDELKNKKAEKNAATLDGRERKQTEWSMLRLRKPKFEGRYTELKDYIFDCSDSRNVDRISTSIKEVA